MSRFVSLIICGLVVTCVGTSNAQEKSTFEEFKEFGDKLIGRWSVDVTLIADWPGEEAKQGDKVVGYTSYKWIVDGKALEWNSVGGMTTARTVITFDATTKTIRAFNVGSAGGHWRTVIWKRNEDDWGWKLIGGGLVDGRKMGGEGSWLFDAGGKSHVIKGNVTLDGEELPQLSDVYSRLSK